MVDSIEISRIEIPEKFEYNGKFRTRTHIIRSMVNGESKFVNYLCGRNSVNISKDKLPEIIDAMKKLQWNAEEKTTDDDSDTKTLLKHLQQLQRQINELRKTKK